jgi:hypothetical protein
VFYMACCGDPFRCSRRESWNRALADIVGARHTALRFTVCEALAGLFLVVRHHEDRLAPELDAARLGAFGDLGRSGLGMLSSAIDLLPQVGGQRRAGC